MKLVVGLGNPGPRYQGTRHNLGFEVLDLLAARWGVSHRRNRFQGELAELALPYGPKVCLLWPHTYMNRSGSSVAQAVAWYGIDPETDLLVVCDDLNLPLGTLRLRASGSDGGQKGLRDILRSLGTDRIPRLRLGIGPLPPGVDASTFVLSRFPPEERAAVEEMVQRAADCVETWWRHGIHRAMTTYNVRPRGERSSGQDQSD